MDQSTLLNFKKLFLEIKKNETIAIRNEGLLGLVTPKGDETDTAQIEREKNLKRKLNLRKKLYLNKIEESLFRIESGEFGLCDECGVEIGLNRLQARPTATECIHCKEENERKEEGRFKLKISSHTKKTEYDNVVGLDISQELVEEENNKVQSISMEKVLRFNKNRFSNEAVF